MGGGPPSPDFGFLGFTFVGSNRVWPCRAGQRVIRGWPGWGATNLPKSLTYAGLPIAFGTTAATSGPRVDEAGPRLAQSPTSRGGRRPYFFPRNALAA